MTHWHNQEPIAVVREIERPPAQASAQEHAIYSALCRLTQAVERAFLSAGILPEAAAGTAIQTEKSAISTANANSA